MKRLMDVADEVGEVDQRIGARFGFGESATGAPFLRIAATDAANGEDVVDRLLQRR